MRWEILCNDCADQIEFEDDRLAIDGRGESDDETNDKSVLACQDWDLPRPPDAMKFFCDECNVAVAVDPTSLWFIDLHREEREALDQSG